MSTDIQITESARGCRTPKIECLQRMSQFIRLESRNVGEIFSFFSSFATSRLLDILYKFPEDLTNRFATADLFP